MKKKPKPNPIVLKTAQFIATCLELQLVEERDERKKKDIKQGIADLQSYSNNK